MKKIHHKSITFFLLSIILVSCLSFYVKAESNGEDIGFTKVSISDSKSFAIKKDGSLWGWGDNKDYDLGDGTNVNSNVPIKIMDMDITDVSAGDIISFALKNDGSVYAWGGYMGESFRTPKRIIDSGVKAIAVDGAGLCYIKDDSSVWRWSDSYASRKKMDKDVAKIAIGLSCSYAIKMDGSLWVWGTNIFGLFGNGSTSSDFSDAPVLVIQGDVTEVATNNEYTMAIKTDGSLWAWGKNDKGQLGDGTNENCFFPKKIIDGNVVSVCAGYKHTLAVMADDSLWAWGNNGIGQLGDGTKIDKNTPIKIIDKDVVAAAAGSSSSMAIKLDGSLYSWGFNMYGELGNGTIHSNYTPQNINEKLQPIKSVNKSPLYLILFAIEFLLLIVMIICMVFIYKSKKNIKSIY